MWLCIWCLKSFPPPPSLLSFLVINSFNKYTYIEYYCEQGRIPASHWAYIPGVRQSSKHINIEDDFSSLWELWRKRELSKGTESDSKANKGGAVFGRTVREGLKPGGSRGKHLLCSLPLVTGTTSPTRILVFIFLWVFCIEKRSCWYKCANNVFYDNMAFSISLLGKMSTVFPFYYSPVACTIISAIMTP